MAIVYIHMKPISKEIYYVGIGKDIIRAYRNKGRNTLWTRVYKKHGKIVEVISDNISLDSAKELEKFLILYLGKICNGTGTLTNLTDGGEGAFGLKHTEESRKKRSEKLKGKPSPNKGKKASEETKRKIGDKSKGRIWSQESRDKLSLTITGRKMPEYAIRATKEKNKANGHKPNREALENATKARRENGIRIKELTNGVEFFLWESEKYFNLPKQTIRKNSLLDKPLRSKRHKGLNFMRI